MFYRVFFVCIVLAAFGCLAQEVNSAGRQERDLNSHTQKLSVDAAASSQPITETSISVVRLRVPGKARDLYEKARNAFLKHKPVEAQDFVDRALQAYPKFPEAMTLSGLIQLDLKQWEAAEQQLQAAVQVDATYGLAHLVLSDLYNREQHFDDAFAAAQKAGALIPHSWYVQYETARALIGSRQFGRALEVSDAALPGNRGTLLHVAKAHALVGLARYADAVAELQTYLQHEPAGEGSEDAHSLLVKLQAAIGH